MSLPQRWHQSSRGWPTPTGSPRPIGPPSISPPGSNLSRLDQVLGYDQSQVISGVMLELGDAALLNSLLLWPWKGALSCWLGSRVLRLRDRWWAFIALLSIIGVLQQLLEMRRMKKPVVFVLICLVWGWTPSSGTTVISPAAELGTCGTWLSLLQGGWASTRAIGSDKGFCQLGVGGRV